MEERIIDDEYGRGIRLKKTKDGYVDVTDELAKDAGAPETEEEADEVEFQFPVNETDEDDEDLVGLSPEEAAALKKRKEEEAAKRRADYESACKQGEEQLAAGDFKGAEATYERALQLDDTATEASVGYWRAKTSDFTDPDVLIAEYVEASIESLEYDLGYEAADIVKRDYRDVFERRVAELEAEEIPLAEEVEGKQALRREVLSARLKKTTVAFIASLLPTLACIILAIVFAFKIPTTRNSVNYIVTTTVFGGLSVAFFCGFIFCANKFINAIRMHRLNEKLTSTEEGERLLEIREYKDLYQALLARPEEERDEEDDSDLEESEE